jgi:hypothetical protein
LLRAIGSYFFGVWSDVLLFRVGISAIVTLPAELNVAGSYEGILMRNFLIMPIVGSLALIGNMAEAQQTTTKQTTTTQATPKQTPAQKLAPIFPAQPPAVSSTTKPSAAGLPVRTQGNQLGFQPAAPKFKPVVVPSPVVTAPKTTTTATTPKTTTTTTTATTTKKP